MHLGQGVPVLRHRCFSAAGLLLIFWAIVCRPAVAQVTFSQPKSYAVDVGPEAVVSGDFNRDGIPDLAVAFVGGSGGVDILLGRGDGTFAPAMNFAAGGRLFKIVVGDFNGDGKPDLFGGGVMLGNGDGSFQPPIYTTGLTVVNGPFAAADFNGDSNSDVVVASGPATVDIFLSNGDGTLRQAGTFTITNAVAITGIVVNDFNGDNQFDIAVSSVGGAEAGMGKVSVLLGNGDGTFQPPTDYDTRGAADSIASGTFHTSANPDLAGTRGSGLFLLSNNGNGTFQVPQALNDFCGTAVGLSPAVGDFDGNGNLDLATFCVVSTPVTLHVLLGNGDGTFQPALVFGVSAISPGSLVVGDINRDGLPDIVFVDVNGNSVTTMLNTSSLFSLVSSHPKLTVNRGGQVSEAINVTANGSFNSAVALSCSVSTPQASCVVSPSSVMPGSSATLTVNAKTASALLNWPGKGLAAVPLYGVCLPLVGLMLVGAGGEGRKRGRKAAHISVMGVLVALLLLQAACGGGGSSPTPAGTYTVTVTGTSGTMTRTTTVSLTVQ